MPEACIDVKASPKGFLWTSARHLLGSAGGRLWTCLWQLGCRNHQPGK